MATAKKKPVAKKTATKKPAAKKPVTKKTTTAKKPAASGRKDAAVKKQTRKGLAGVLRSKTPTSKTGMNAGFTRRPDPNIPPDPDSIHAISQGVQQQIVYLSNYAAHLRALDRMRHNGVGIHRQGFIERALLLAQENPEYLPHWLSVQKFETDHELFVALRALAAAIKQLQELSWNITVEAADMAFTDALEFYSQVQDAANRRVDSAEALYEDLHPFFRRGPMQDENGEPAPTQKKAKRDFNAVMKGKKEGKVGVKNIKPKIAGGKREIIDETFKAPEIALRSSVEEEI